MIREPTDDEVDAAREAHQRPPDGMLRTAIISQCGRYRYLLSRSWWGIGPKVTWIMLNPSTADANVDDPTIRKCIGFTKQWGYVGFDVVNLFAWRATKPNELKAALGPIGNDNNGYIYSTCANSPLIVAAWGAHGTSNYRGAIVASDLRERGLSLKCLGRTNGGQPRHPLMLPYATALEDYQ